MGTAKFVASRSFLDAVNTCFGYGAHGTMSVITEPYYSLTAGHVPSSYVPFPDSLNGARRETVQYITHAHKEICTSESSCMWWLNALLQLMYGYQSRQ